MDLPQPTAGGALPRPKADSVPAPPPPDDENLPRLRLQVLRTLGAFLVVLALLAAVVGLGAAGVGFVWVPVSMLLGLAFYALAPRAPWLTVVAKPLSPLFGELLRRQEQIGHNRVVVEKMSHALRVYGLPAPGTDDGERRRLVNSLPAHDSEPARIRHCAAGAARHLASSAPHVTAPLLELLYQERHGSAAMPWTEKKELLVPGLARVLSDGGLLRSRRYAAGWAAPDVERLLRPLADFTLGAVRDQAEAVGELWTRASRYLDFLAEHGVAHGKVLASPGSVLPYLEPERLPLEPGTADAALLHVLATVGEDAVRAAYGLPDPLPRAVCLVSLALFFSDLSEAPGLRREVCRCAAGSDQAVRLTFAYLEFREDLRTESTLDGKRFVSVEYLVGHWAVRVDEKERTLKGFAKEIETIRATLGRGEWVTGLAYVVQKTYETIRRHSRLLRRLEALAARRPSVPESLKRVARGLTLETVERYLEARTVNAYLLTFRGENGPVADLLNCMVAPDSQAALAKLRIALQANGRPVYNFKQYTKNARIGVVPRGWSFERFHRAFQADFTRVVEARETLVPEWDYRERDLKNIELIVHRFGLSGRNYHGFVSPVTREYAIEKIKELFADMLDPADLTALIQYEKDEPAFVGALLEGPITELVGKQLALSDAERKVIDARDARLRAEICLVLRLSGPPELGRYLRKGRPGRLEKAVAAAGPQFAVLVAGTAPELDAVRSTRIVEVYLETLRDLAALEA